MATEIHGVRIKKIIYKTPKTDEDEPVLELTLSIEGSHTAQAKKLLDFAQSGICTWAVEAVSRELSEVPRAAARV